jgi:hypothetical protein
MDKNRYNLIIQALSVIFEQSYSSSNDTKVQATIFLDSVKQDVSAIHYVHHILEDRNNPSHSPLIQFATLKLFQVWITENWNKLSESESNDVCNSILYYTYLLD